MKRILYLFAATLLITSCRQQTPANNQADEKMPAPRFTPIKTTYRILASSDSIKKLTTYWTTEQQRIIVDINRTDAEHLVAMDSILIPADMQGNIQQYSPFPQQLPLAQKLSKIIFFSYPTQYFGAYENGQLVYSGPTNMGREKDKTPTGLFYTNWKAEETRSTFNDEWELKWNVNIANKEGVGWHQYAMPGYPASHSCLRLLEADAKYLYSWADTWKLKGDEITSYGTPVIVFGAYPFGSPKPWLQLPTDPGGLNITTQTLDDELSPHLNEIISRQQQRDSLAN